MNGEFRPRRSGSPVSGIKRSILINASELIVSLTNAASASADNGDSKRHPSLFLRNSTLNAFSLGLSGLTCCTPRASTSKTGISNTLRLRSSSRPTSKLLISSLETTCTYFPLGPSIYTLLPISVLLPIFSSMDLFAPVIRKSMEGSSKP